MQEFWSIFENFIKNNLISFNNLYTKENFIEFLIELLKKKNLEEKYINESFMMFLDYLDLDDENFRDIKLLSIRFLEEFFIGLGDSS